MTTPAMVGDRVRVLRLACNVSQSELAKKVSSGASDANGLISKIENGRQPLDADLLDAMAAALGCTPAYLSSGPIDILATRPWLRAYADAPARVVEGIAADNMLVAEMISRLQLKRIPDRIPTFDGDPNDDDALERFAGDVRMAAQIDDGAVVGNAVRAAERLGCVVLPMPGELGRHLGMSHRIDGWPFIRVSRPGLGESHVPGDRQRFTVLHEVGHLALHSDVPPPESAEASRRVERQAHRFASAFLAPAEPLLEDWHSRGGRVTLAALAELKSTWGIAIKALVVRFQQLGIVNADQATSLYKQISKRGWNKAEPVETTNETPIWLARAIEKRVEGVPGRNAVAKAAGLSMLSESHIERWVDWSPAPEPGLVLALFPAPPVDGIEAREDGQLLKFPRGRGH